MYLTVYRIDPAKKAIAALRLPMHKRNFSKHYARMLRTRESTHKVILPNKEPGRNLLVSAAQAVPAGVAGFRIRGTKEATAGLAVLSGSAVDGGILHCPVDLKWLERMIVWLSPEEMDAELALEIAEDDKRLIGIEAE